MTHPGFESSPGGFLLYLYETQAEELKMTREQDTDRLYEVGEQHNGKRSSLRREVIFAEPDDLLAAAIDLHMSVHAPSGYHPTSIFLAPVGELGVYLAKSPAGCPKGWNEDPRGYYKLYGKPSRLHQQSVDLSGFRNACRRNGDSTLLADGGWYSRLSDGLWHRRGLSEIRMMIQSIHNVSASVASTMMGGLCRDPWELVFEPFKSEYPYPGKKIWNRDAPQSRFKPEPGTNWRIGCPHWAMVYDHVSKDLKGRLPPSIPTPGDYILMWFASLVQNPADRRPYLFLFGPENSGKSILHESFDLLVTSGVVKADRALTSSANFNGELAESVLCIVEEIDLSKSRGALDKLKDYVTSPRLSIRKMYQDSYMATNYSSWIQTSNSRHGCPIFDGQTRIVALNVEPPERDVPKEELIAKLKSEAPRMVWHLLNTKLPPSEGRLALPAIQTASTERLQAESRHPLISEIPDVVELEWSGSARDLAVACGLGGPNDLRSTRKILDAHQSYLKSQGITVDYSDNRRKPIVIRRI